MIKKTNTKQLPENSKKNKKRIVKIILLSIAVIIIVLGVWVGTSAYRAVAKVTSASSSKNSLLSLLKKSSTTTLEGQSDGRTNILFLGEGGGNHPGAALSDTMEVLSINWKTNQMAMLSVPRDLEVNVPGYGYAKINNANATGGGKLASQVVSQILGIPIQYFVTLNFTGFTDIVNSVGGVDINVPQAIYDPLYPAYDNGPYSLFKLSAGQHHMDGALALKYARSRETTSDFDRAKRQQQIMEALKSKFLSLNFLADPLKVTSLLNTLGGNLLTSLSVNESYALWTEIKGIDSSNIITKVLDDSANNVLTDQTNELGDVLIPKKGLKDYTDLQAVAQGIFSADSMINTNPKIEVLNGSGKAGQALSEASTLKTEGYTSVSTNDTTKTVSSIVYNCGGTPTQAVANKIATELNAFWESQTSCGNFDIKIILGQNILIK